MGVRLLKPEAIQVSTEGLSAGDRWLPSEDITGFDEVFSPWTGQVSLRIAEHWIVAVGEGYGPLRRALRDHFPDRPFRAPWREGRFPSMPFGRPPGWAAVAVFAVATLVGALAGWVGALMWPAAVVAGWWAARALSTVTVTMDGIRAGPAWAPVIPWYEVEAVGLDKRAPAGADVVVVHRHGVERATLPATLVPALRASSRRLGAVEVGAVPGGAIAWYHHTRGWWSGAAWGVWLAGCMWAASHPADAWVVLWWFGLLALGVGLVAGAVGARVSGWGAGAVLAMTAAYGAALWGVARWVAP